MKNRNVLPGRGLLFYQKTGAPGRSRMREQGGMRGKNGGGRTGGGGSRNRGG